MRVAVVTDAGSFNLTLGRGPILAGKCPLCRAPLEVLPSDHDTDAVCLACGGVVGRVYPRATVDANGTVTTHRRRGRR